MMEQSLVETIQLIKDGGLDNPPEFNDSMGGESKLARIENNIVKTVRFSIQTDYRQEPIYKYELDIDRSDYVDIRGRYKWQYEREQGLDRWHTLNDVSDVNFLYSLENQVSIKEVKDRIVTLTILDYFMPSKFYKYDFELYFIDSKFR